MIPKNTLKQLINQLFLLVEAVKQDKEINAKMISKEVLKEYSLTKEKRELLISLIETNNHQNNNQE